MILILARLQFLTLKGRLIRSYRLLRQPKYLVGSIVGVGWIAFWVIRPLLRSNAKLGMQWTESLSGMMPTMHRVVAVFATILLPLPWLLPFARLGLPFREAELTMLLQAPLTRRQVVQYGLLKSEVGVVISALVASFFLRPGSPVDWLLGFFGTWLVFELMHLNGKWRALTFASPRGWRLPVTIGLLAFYVVLLSALSPFIASVIASLRGMDRTQVVAALTALEWPPLIVALSTPAWWLTAPVFATSGAAFLVAIIPLLIAVIAQREIVLRTKVRFEESALEQAKTQEARVYGRSRVTKRRLFARAAGPFVLNAEGPPEIAVVWKNAMRISRLPWIWILGSCVALLIAIAVLPAALRLPDLTYALLAMFGLVLLFVQPLFGGMSWNNDLRTELAHIESVRTWPVAPARFMLAEIVSPAIMSFAGSMFGAGVVLVSLFGSRLRQLFTGEPTELHLLPRGGELLGVDNAWAAVLLFVSIVPMSAALSFLSSALQNLAVLWMPAWMVHTADRSRGIAAFGQRMISSFALGLSFVVALVPSALIVGAAMLGQRALGIPWSAWALPFWGVLAAIPPLAMGLGLLRLAVPLWERLDPSAELLESGR